MVTRGTVAAVMAFLTAGLAVAAESARVTITCVSVQAMRTGHGGDAPIVDAALRNLQEIAAVAIDPDMRRYDTYRLLSRGGGTVAFEEEATIRINERYTLFATPLSRDRQGRIQLSVRIEERPDPRNRRNDEEPEPRIALQATSMLVPGNHLKLEGLNLDEGKLIVVIEATPAR